MSEVPPHLLAVAGLSVAKTPVLVEEPTGRVGKLILGESIREVARRLRPGRRTIGRWWQWLAASVDAHALHLRSRFAELGRAVDWKGFWALCFERMSLGEAMGWLDHAGVRVP